MQTRRPVVLPPRFLGLEKQSSFFQNGPIGQTMRQVYVFVPAGVGSDISGVLGRVSRREERMNTGIKV